MRLLRRIFCKFGIVIATNRSMMKKTILILLIAVLGVNLSTAQKKANNKINWVTFEEAVKLQKKNPKKIMVDVYTVWCGPCKMLDKNTFQNQDVVDYVNKNYYAVKFNAQGNSEIKLKDRVFSNPGYNPANAQRRNATHELARYFRIQAFPTIVYLDEGANFITGIRGYQKPQELELYLKMFKENKHKDMKTQDEFIAYAKAFVPAFKG